jgi:hypothetical protein
LSQSCSRLFGIIASFLSKALLIGEQTKLSGGAHD